MQGAAPPAQGDQGEASGQTGVTYNISDQHWLGFSEVKLIDGVNTLWKLSLRQI